MIMAINNYIRRRKARKKMKNYMVKLARTTVASSEPTINIAIKYQRGIQNARNCRNFELADQLRHEAYSQYGLIITMDKNSTKARWING